MRGLLKIFGIVKFPFILKHFLSQYSSHKTRSIPCWDLVAALQQLVWLLDLRECRIDVCYDKVVETFLSCHPFPTSALNVFVRLTSYKLLLSVVW